MAGLWQFISDPANRDALAWIGGGLCVVASGLWVVIKHLSAKPPPATPKPAKEWRAEARGIAAVGNVSAGRDVVVGDVALPRLALCLAALGMVLLALALILGGGDTITGSVVIDGDIAGSDITVSPPPSDE